jgi:hypothetical protein
MVSWAPRVASYKAFLSVAECEALLELVSTALPPPSRIVTGFKRCRPMVAYEQLSLT